MRAWVLLRGLAREKRHWGNFIEDFQKLVPEDKIICLDFPGNGEFIQMKSCLSIEQNVEFLKKQSLPPQFNLIGISLGGMLSLQWAMTDARVQKVVVINSSDSHHASPFERFSINAFMNFIKMMALKKDRYQIEMEILNATSNLTSQEKQHWASLFKDYPMTSNKNFFRQLTAAAQFKLNTENFNKPCLVVCGAKDRLVRPACSKRLAQALNCELSEHPWAGHDLSLDDSRWLAEQIRSSLC